MALLVLLLGFRCLLFFFFFEIVKADFYLSVKLSMT